MGILPQEMATQRRKTACVSAPGVNLWSTATAYLPDYEIQIVNTDTVSAGEVEIAQSAPTYPQYELEPEYFGHAYSYGGGDYGDGPYGETRVPPDNDVGLFQFPDFGEGAFGEGVFGGADLEYNNEVIQYGYPFEGDE